MHPAAYIVDIAYLKTTEKLKPGIALSVVNTYSDCPESYSPDIYFVSKRSLFVLIQSSQACHRVRKG